MTYENIGYGVKKEWQDSESYGKRCGYLMTYEFLLRPMRRP